MVVKVVGMVRVISDTVKRNREEMCGFLFLLEGECVCDLVVVVNEKLRERESLGCVDAWKSFLFGFWGLAVLFLKKGGKKKKKRRV